MTQFTDNDSSTKTCIIVGASHGGVNASFALRKEGWQGEIILIDSDPDLPYHRPPLSKAFLIDGGDAQPARLKSEASYQKSNIKLNLGVFVKTIDKEKKVLQLDNNEIYHYDKLIISTGASAFIPPISGIENSKNIFTLRSSADVKAIKTAFSQAKKKRVVIIGGGYIGLETAASIKKLGGSVTVIEREERLLARVTSPAMSVFFEQLHSNNDITIKTGKTVQALDSEDESITVTCDDNSQYSSDIVIIGVGVKVNQALAEEANLTISNGIKVNSQCRTSEPDIFAVGDCTFHHNKFYGRWIRLESVQNAVDQAKIAAATICGKQAYYDALPWFWSDQFNIKLQMVGLNSGYDNIVVRKENNEDAKFSVWYFQKDKLLSVDTVNHPKAYVLATKLLKQGSKIDKAKLANTDIELSLDVQDS